MGEDSASRKATRYFVSGMVQGVGYRFFAKGAAIRLDLKGFVRNLSDGRVEVYAIGRDEALARLKTELGRGPRGAVVANVTEENVPVDLRFVEGFLIER